ncbi:MAG TPA: alpha/beta hydrolase [Mycobacterium sp.]|nr:alpha/beta hydrolase [Mycobacterium sp.]
MALRRRRRPTTRKTANATLLRGALELTNAANGVRSLARQGYITIPLFFLGWPTSELAPWLGMASVLDAARRGWRGDFRGRRGMAGLALTVLSWVLLAFIHRRNITSAPHFEEPLREALGEDYEAAAHWSRMTLAGGLFRSAAARLRYVAQADTVSYGPHRANRLDIWHRSDLPLDAKAPVLVNVPGGAWLIGMRRPQAYPLMGRLAAEGWICVSIGYRVSPRWTWPDHVVDAKRALAWVHEHIADYGGDPDCIAISGGSAGGHLSSLCALTQNDPAWQPGFEAADTSVVAAVPIYGRYDWDSTEGPGRVEFVRLFLQRLVVKKKYDTHRHIYQQASPIRHVRADAPPFFVLHGRNDSIIPVGEAREFVTALREVSEAPVVYAEIPGAQHAFEIFGSSHGQYTAAAVQKFLDWMRAKRGPQPVTPPAAAPSRQP